MAEQTDIKFSVVIPVFNAAGSIETALTSCLQQSYTSYEIIVVDDASTDATASILTKYAQQIKYVRLPVNQGSAAARNAGLDIANGAYIAFLDADDVWHKDKLQIMYGVLHQRPDIRFLYHYYAVAGRDDAAFADAVSTAKVPALHQLSFWQLLLHNTIATPCMVMHNEKGLRFNAAMRHTEDYDLWLRIRYRYPIYFINLPLTIIGRPVLSKGGLSAARWQMRQGELHAYLRLAKLNALFTLLFPFLFIFSLLKYIRKAITGV